MPDPAPTLYVDLDGTLIASDTLWDSIALVLRHRPWMLVMLPFWLLRGRAGFKDILVKQVCPDPALLPYRVELVEYLRAARNMGRRIVLATAAHERIALGVSSHLGCFDQVLASGPGTNLKGLRKLAAIRADANGTPFCYAGDSAADLPIWAASAGAILAGRGLRFATHIGVPIEARFGNSTSFIPSLVKALRPHQWVKNILVFLPLIASHRILDLQALSQATLLFVAFSLCASSVYLVNDLVDIEHDRPHPRKCRRPFAAGSLPVVAGLILAPLLAAAAAGIAASISLATLGTLGLYFAVTTAYSFSLKRRMLVDVFTLASLYTLRSLAGNVAIDVPLSPWLMAFLVFLFLSLAFCKRYAELDQVARRGERGAAGRGYRVDDLTPVGIFGIGSGFLAALVLGLYVTGTTVSQLYGSPSLLWLAAPLILFWICRVWLKTWRGEMHDDPILFAAKDRTTYLVVLFMASLLLAAGPKGLS